jgi:hypothetical protein
MHVAHVVPSVAVIQTNVSSFDNAMVWLKNHVMIVWWLFAANAVRLHKKVFNLKVLHLLKDNKWVINV